MRDHSGSIEPIGPKGLAALIAGQPHLPQVVVLMSCFSKVLANALRRHVDVVVGTTGELPDDCSGLFTGQFYQALLRGEHVQSAFDGAHNHVRAVLEGRGGSTSDAVRLFYREGVLPDAIVPFPAAKRRNAAP